MKILLKVLLVAGLTITCLVLGWRVVLLLLAKILPELRDPVWEILWTTSGWEITICLGSLGVAVLAWGIIFVWEVVEVVQLCRRKKAR